MRDRSVTLLLTGQSPMHWAVAGLVIAVVTLALLFIGNRRLGISTGLEDVCSFVLRAPYFSRGAVTGGRGWRLPFLAGLVLGGVVSAGLSGGWQPTWELGVFDSAVGVGPLGKVLWMFGGGLLVGFGTRLAGGCTSGHGIFGLANLELPSLAAVLAFMAGGLATTYVVYGWLFPL
jgi:uncharacterized membrane protein YedE/YeeE